MPTVEELSIKLDKDFFHYQLDCFDLWPTLPQNAQRLCLYYKTGAGKSITSLSCVALSGYKEALVVAPPISHPDWVALGEQLDITVTAVSHAKFRMADFKVGRGMPVIADEFHLFGGHSGKGWKKLDRMAKGLQAPLILCSATPNYNDAERVYCVQHVLDPHSAKGGYLEFLYTHCKTTQNQFGTEPIVEGFLRFASAEDYLSSLPNVVCVPDTTVIDLIDIPVQPTVPEEFELYGLDRRNNRIMASQIEATFRRQYLNLINEEELIREHVYDMLTDLVGQAHTPVLLYCHSSRIAERLWRSCLLHQVEAELVTGTTPSKAKQASFNRFRGGELDVLIGTATLATGADGIDKVCDTLIIVDDTTDNALRRQLMGRILPRGKDTDVSRKQLFRLVF